MKKIQSYFHLIIRYTLIVMINNMNMINESDHTLLHDSSVSRLFGKIHWNISLAHKIIERQQKISCIGEKPDFLLKDANKEKFTDFGKKTISREISWWIYDKENNHDFLLLKIENLLPSIEKIYGDILKLKKDIPDNYSILLNQIVSFNEEHKDEIHNFYEFVEYLHNLDPTSPIILFSFESTWSSTQLSNRFFYPVHQESDDNEINCCTEILLGMRNIQDNYFYNRVLNEILSEIFESCPEEVTSTPNIDSKILMTRVQREIIDEFEKYILNIRNSLRKIIFIIHDFKSKKFVIRNINVDFSAKKRVRVAIIQLNYELDKIKTSYGYTVKDEDYHKKKLISALLSILKDDIDIIGLPEAVQRRSYYINSS